MNTNFDLNGFVASYYNSLSLAFTEICGRSHGGGALELMPNEVERILLPYRKEAGITISWFALLHAVGLIFKYNIFDITKYLNPAGHLLYAALATIFIIILGITSNNFSTETLGPNWKRIQYLAYPALLLTLFHTSRVAKNMNKFYIIGGLFVVLKIIEWSIHKEE